MGFAQRTGLLILALVSVGADAQSSDQKLTVVGKLVRVMAIGAESTGWAIEMGSAITIDNKQVNSIQVRYHSASKLEKLTNKQVRASGKLVRRQGVETGEQPVLNISPIKEAKAADELAPGRPKPQ